MTRAHRPTAPPERVSCPRCYRPVEVLPTGLLAFRFPVPGTGQPCPPINTKERLR